MRPPTPVLVLLTIGVAGLLAACGDDGPDTASTPADGAPEGPVVTIEQSRYEPETIEVAVGAGVVFENLDPFAHTVTAAEGSPISFASGELGQDETFAFAFDSAGTYEYFCEIHPTMRAEVVVSS